MQERAKRSPGCAFDADWVASARVNRSAVERRTDPLTKRRTVKKDWQAAWLLRAVQTIDLTTLSGDDTPGTVRRLCAKARQPLRATARGGRRGSRLGLWRGLLGRREGQLWPGPRVK